MKEKWISNFKAEHIIKEFIKKRGIDRYLIEELPETFDRNVKEGENYYYYAGPLDEKTRDFCAMLLKMDKVLSERDIASLSKKIGYNVYELKGNFNCRHKWVRFRGKIILTPKITPNQIRGLDRKAVKR